MNAPARHRRDLRSEDGDVAVRDETATGRELARAEQSGLATTSDRCTHLLEPVQRAAADRMDDLLRQVTPGSGA